jgi:hypothetical protein
MKENITIKIEEQIIKKGRKQKYATDEERKEAKRIQTIASNKKRYAEKKAIKETNTHTHPDGTIMTGKKHTKNSKILVEGSGINDTYRNKFNKKYGFDKNKSHSIEEISKITGYNIDGLKIIYDKGIGAYHTNPQSVRPQVKSAEQWAMARIYSAVMGGKAANIDKTHLIKGNGILQDISTGVKDVASSAKKGLQTVVNYTEKTAEDVKNYGKAVIYGRMDYPPKVRTILQQNGDEIITSYKIKRTPVPSLLVSALSAVSLGSFGKRFGRSEYDELFHLFLEMTTQSGKKISVEKNEVINMDISPPSRDKEEVKNITSNIPSGLTINELMNKTEERMGKTDYFGYSARDNNCQDFIVSVLKANNIGDETDQKFVKQDTKELFENLPFLRKFSNTLTTIGARVNVLTTGAGFNNNTNTNENIISTNSIKKMPKGMSRKMKGMGTPLFDQKFSVNEAGDFFRNDVPQLFRGRGLLDQKFSVNEAGDFFRNDVPQLFRGRGLFDQKFSVNEAGDFFRNDVPQLFRGRGLLDQQFSVNEAGDFFRNDVPQLFRGGSCGGKLIQGHMCPTCETSMSGGRIDIGAAFRDLGRDFERDVIRPADNYITSKKGGLASDLIQYGLPSVGSALLSPVAGVAGSALGSKLGSMAAQELKKATGTGMVRKGRFAKGSQEARDYMASIRKKKN